VQVLQYQGYDKEKKRAKVAMIASFDAYADRVPDSLKEKLTDDQLAEIQAYIDVARQERKAEEDSILLSIADRQIAQVTDYILNLATGSHDKEKNDRQTKDKRFLEAKAPLLWQAISDLQKALKKAGHPRPAKKKVAIDTFG